MASTEQIRKFHDAKMLGNCLEYGEENQDGALILKMHF